MLKSEIYFYHEGLKWLMDTQVMGKGQGLEN